MKKYNLLLPIAGKAQRFIDAGYTMPKALILAKNKHVIDWAMDSIDTKDCNLIFMVRVDHVYNFSIDKILKQISDSPTLEDNDVIQDFTKELLVRVKLDF